MTWSLYLDKLETSRTFQLSLFKNKNCCCHNFKLKTHPRKTSTNLINIRNFRRRVSKLGQLAVCKVLREAIKLLGHEQSLATEISAKTHNKRSAKCSRCKKKLLGHGNALNNKKHKQVTLAVKCTHKTMSAFEIQLKMLTEFSAGFATSCYATCCAGFQCHF